MNWTYYNITNNASIVEILASLDLATGGYLAFSFIAIIFLVSLIITLYRIPRFALLMAGFNSLVVAFLISPLMSATTEYIPILFGITIIGVLIAYFMREVQTA